MIINRKRYNMYTKGEVHDLLEACKMAIHEITLKCDNPSESILIKTITTSNQ